MFIRNSQYQALFQRINALEHQCAALEQAGADMRNDETALLFAFSEDIGEIRLQTAALTERIRPLEEQAEQLSEDRQAERRFIRGANNILNYGVTYGRSKTQQADR